MSVAIIGESLINNFSFMKQDKFVFQDSHSTTYGLAKAIEEKECPSIGSVSF